MLHPLALAQTLGDRVIVGLAGLRPRVSTHLTRPIGAADWCRRRNSRQVGWTSSYALLHPVRGVLAAHLVLDVNPEVGGGT